MESQEDQGASLFSDVLPEEWAKRYLSNSTDDGTSLTSQEYDTALAELLEVIKRRNTFHRRICLTDQEEMDLSIQFHEELETIISKVRSATMKELDLNEGDVFARFGYRIRSLFERVIAIDTDRDPTRTWPKSRFIQASDRFETFAQRTGLLQRGEGSLDHRLGHLWPADGAKVYQTNHGFLERFEFVENSLVICLKYSNVEQDDYRWQCFFVGGSGESLASSLELSMEILDGMDKHLDFNIFFTRLEKFLQPFSWLYWLRYLTS
ncbi:hypothetical protein PT974_00783 [Cladobotryum mycophilum]|uniref:Uncharacterized protein n=1 Tax=Cladobotryum mycophilum TaxID=491253 RepID=A0ABR0T2E3_9HYPO